MNNLKVSTREMEWGGRKLVLETGKVAKQATGAVVVTYGETKVLATVCAAKEAKADQDFFPLTVNYQEKYYATGKVPGGFMKREGKPSEHEVLVSRLIDRPIRPLFPDAFKNEVQIICTTLCHDQKTTSDVVAMIAASAALAVSGIPFMGPIGAAKVGYKNGEFILNPTIDEQKESELELTVAGTKEGVLMVESEANELSEETMLNAVMFGFDSFQPVIDMICDLAKEAGKEPWETPAFPKEFDAMYERIAKAFRSRYEEAFTETDKLKRGTLIGQLDEEVKALAEKDWQLLATQSNVGLQQAQLAIQMNKQKVKLERSELLPKIALVAGEHLDGPITIEVPVLDNNFNYWYVGVGIKYNLSSLFKNNKKVRQAKLNMRKAQEEYSLAQEQIENGVQANYVNFLTSFTDLRTQEKSVELANQNYNVTSNRYKNDLALLTDMLDASNMKLSADLGLVNARINVVYSYYKMKYITHTL